MTPIESLVSSLNLLLSQNIADDAVLCPIIAKRLAKALRPNWLPPEARAADDERYRRHLLFEDPGGRFSIGSFVWKPGQETPIHDHTCWGVMGVAEGRLVSENFDVEPSGQLRFESCFVIPAGFTEWLSPARGDIHRIANRAKQTTATSIHVYGAPLSSVCRAQYDGAAGASIPFASPAPRSGQRGWARF
jgi:3-mercaptopropionate dioxygenase